MEENSYHRPGPKLPTHETDEHSSQTGLLLCSCFVPCLCLRALLLRFCENAAYMDPYANYGAVQPPPGAKSTLEVPRGVSFK